MKRAIALFDVDGTLISTSAGRTGLERTFEQAFGSADFVSFSFAGMTDRAIIRIGLERAKEHGHAVPRVEDLFEPYLQNLRADLDDPDTRYRVLPGVTELLDAIEASGNIAHGLGTGNLEQAAKLKLLRGDLWHRFDFGGYASDAEARESLIKAGWDRGATRCHPDAPLFVIGDTPKDIAAGHANDAFVIAVATGRFTADELSQADLVVESLEDPAVFRAVS